MSRPVPGPHLDPHYVLLSCLLKLFLINARFSELFLTFMTVLKNMGQMLCESPLGCDFSNVFSISDGGSVWKRKSTEGKAIVITSYQAYTLSPWSTTVRVDLDHLAEPGSSGSPPWDCFSPFSCCTFLEGNHREHPTFMEWGFILTP